MPRTHFYACHFTEYHCYEVWSMMSILYQPLSCREGCPTNTCSRWRGRSAARHCIDSPVWCTHWHLRTQSTVWLALSLWYSNCSKHTFSIDRYMDIVTWTLAWLLSTEGFSSKFQEPVILSNNNNNSKIIKGHKDDLHFASVHAILNTLLFLVQNESMIEADIHGRQNKFHKHMFPLYLEQQRPWQGYPQADECHAHKSSCLPSHRRRSFPGGRKKSANMYVSDSILIVLSVATLRSLGHGRTSTPRSIPAIIVQ